MSNATCSNTTSDVILAEPGAVFIWGEYLAISNPSNHYVQVRILAVNASDTNDYLLATKNLGNGSNPTWDTSADAQWTAQKILDWYVIWTYANALTSGGVRRRLKVEVGSYSNSGYSSPVGYTFKYSDVILNPTTTVHKPTLGDFDLSAVNDDIDVIDSYGNELISTPHTTLTDGLDKMIRGITTAQAYIDSADRGTYQKLGMIKTQRMTATRKNAGVVSSQTVEDDYDDIAFVPSYPYNNWDSSYLDDVPSNPNITLQIEKIWTNSVSVKAVDWRDTESDAITKQFSVIAEHDPVSIGALTFVRDNFVDSPTKLQFSGTVWNKYFSTNTTSGGNPAELNSVQGADYRFRSTVRSDFEVYDGEVTISNASPAVVTNVDAGDGGDLMLTSGQRVWFSTAGSLPTGLSADTYYYVHSINSTTFNLASNKSDAIAGTNLINTSSAGSGTHTLHYDSQWTDISVDVSVDSSGNIAFDEYINGDLDASGFDADRSFIVEVRIYDKVSIIEVQGTLNVGTPLMHYTQDGVAFGARYDNDEGSILQMIGRAVDSGWFTSPIMTFDSMEFPYAKVIAEGDISHRINKGTKLVFKQLGAGDNEYSLSLDGTNDTSRISDASQSGLDITGDISIEAWIYVNGAESSQRSITGKYNTIGNQRGYQLNVVENGHLAFIVSDNGSFTTGHAQTYESDYMIPTDQWVHVAVTFDISSETCKLFFNGAIVPNTKAFGTTLGASIFNNNADFCVGSMNSGTVNFFNGNILEVRVWNLERTESEIAINYCKNLVGDESGLQGYWKFNNDHTDETANSNNLTAYGYSTAFVTSYPTQLTKELMHAVVMDINVSGDTTLSLFFGQDNGIRPSFTITDIEHSHYPTPVGFDKNPGKWSYNWESRLQLVQSAPTQNTFYHLGQLSMFKPKGLWEMSYECIYGFFAGTAFQVLYETTLSTTTNSRTDLDWTLRELIKYSVSGAPAIFKHKYKKRIVESSSIEIYNLLILIDSSNVTNAYFRSDYHPTRLKLTCPYI